MTRAKASEVGQKRITNSKDLRKLRKILPDPVAREHFLSEEGNLDSAMLRLGHAAKKAKGGLAGDLEAAVESMRRVPWTTLADLKGDREILKKIDDAEALLKSLHKTLSS
jgi:ParB family chromosome partitioning protein